jgi:hypothetical protein
MDGSAAVHARDAFKLIYAEAFTEPPCNETADDVATAFRRFASRTGSQPRLSRCLGPCFGGEPIDTPYG